MSTIYFKNNSKDLLVLTFIFVLVDAVHWLYKAIVEPDMLTPLESERLDKLIYVPQTCHLVKTNELLH